MEPSKAITKGTRFYMFLKSYLIIKHFNNTIITLFFFFFLVVIAVVLAPALII